MAYIRNLCWRVKIHKLTQFYAKFIFGGPVFPLGSKDKQTECCSQQKMCKNFYFVLDCTVNCIIISVYMIWLIYHISRSLECNGDTDSCCGDDGTTTIRIVLKLHSMYSPPQFYSCLMWLGQLRKKEKFLKFLDWVVIGIHTG